MLNKFKIFICFVLVLSAFLSLYTRPILNMQQKNYKFLLCISSFKRPFFLSGQIWRLMNQSYQNFDISVSVKGVEEPWADKTFKKEWQPFVEKNRLFLRFDGNRAQMSNFLDTIRDIDLSQYDYFCKIDDDDWYAPDYLEDVNNSLNLKNGATISSSLNAYVLSEDIEKTNFSLNKTDITGSTMCFSGKVLRVALEIEKDPELLKKYLSDRHDPIYLVAREDAVLDHLSLALGEKVNRTSGYPKVLYGQQYRSVTRNSGYVQH